MNRGIPFLLNVLRGFLMGSADVVPGVSGGTVALIVGVYERLVGAISRFDIQLLGYVRKLELRKAICHVDFPFLASLGFGIAVAIVTLGSTMESLLVGATSRPLTLAAFFGMILASTIVVARWINAPRLSDKWWYSSMGVAAAAFAFWITGLQASSAEVTLGYVFLCGMIGICAMILPGLSGAYLLLVLGMYSHLTDILHRLPHLDVGFRDLVTVAVFGAGCAIGLVAFSKVLRWLLSTARGIYDGRAVRVYDRRPPQGVAIANRPLIAWGRFTQGKDLCPSAANGRRSYPDVRCCRRSGDDHGVGN